MKGFTLIELLIVIAIVAVLSMAVYLYINPVQLLKQSRDSNRISDLSTLQSAIALYQSDVSESSLGTPGVCYMASSVGTSTALCGLYFQTASSTATSTSQALDGTGWLPINFLQISSGNPISQLPLDPLGGNDPDFFYSYITDSSRFKLAAKMESQLFGPGGDKDVALGDGGISASTYEAGTGLAL